MLIYFYNIKNQFIFKDTKPSRNFENDMIKNSQPIEEIEQIFNTFNSPKSNAKKLKILSGKLFPRYYCDVKIAENKVNLNYNLLHSDILIGVFFQQKGSLIVGKFLKKLYYFNRYKFFNFEVNKNFFKKKFTYLTNKNKLINSAENTNFFGKNFHIFFNSRSRLNLGILEKFSNLQVSNLKNLELFSIDKDHKLNFRNKAVTDIRIIEIRRNRIFNLEKYISFSKKKIGLYFIKGLSSCISSCRFSLQSSFFLSGSILFSRKNIFFEINKSIFDWFFQLKKENLPMSIRDFGFFRSIHLRNFIALYDFSIFNQLSSINKKKFKFNNYNQSQNFSLFKNEILWNNTLSSSELALDFFFKISDSLSAFFPHCKWKHFFQLIHFHIFFNGEDKLLSNLIFKENQVYQFFHPNLNFNFLNLKGWSNVIFDSKTFLKVKKNLQSMKSKISDVSQTSKLFRVIGLKLFW